MNVLEMIKRQLIVNNVDGLFNSKQDCGYLLNDDFASCGNFLDYPGPYFDCGEHDYHVGSIK